MAMPTAIITSLQTNASTYADNMTYAFSPFHPQLALGSMLSNLRRMTRPQMGVSYIPQTTSSMNTLKCVR